MISRRLFLGSAPIAAIAAPSIVKALPAPMPIVDAGAFGETPWRGDPSDNPRTLSRIWSRWIKIRNRIEGYQDIRYYASDIKRLMIDVVEDVTGHKPPFILRAHCGTYNEFIFHPVSNTIPSETPYGRLEGGDLLQPCYIIEWTPVNLKRVVSDQVPIRKALVEPMGCMGFKDASKIIYDL